MVDTHEWMVDTHEWMVDSSSSSVKAVLDTTLNCPNILIVIANALNTKLHVNDKMKKHALRVLI